MTVREIKKKESFKEIISFEIYLGVVREEYPKRTHVLSNSQLGPSQTE